MGSKSSSSNQTASTTNDNRVIAEGGGMGVSGGGDVSVHVVADEAFELGELAIASGDASTLAALEFGRDALDKLTGNFDKALSGTQAAYARADESEETLLSSQIIKIGIPAAALAFIAAQWARG